MGDTAKIGDEVAHAGQCPGAPFGIAQQFVTRSFVARQETLHAGFDARFVTSLGMPQSTEE